MAEKVQKNGTVDRSTIVIDNFDRNPLIPYLSEEHEAQVLFDMCRRWSDEAMPFCPNLHYWAMDARRHMSRPDNTTGYQQRAFDFYWTIRTLLAGGITLGIGTTPCHGPGVLGTDKYIMGERPDGDSTQRYGPYGASPHFRMDAQETFPFIDGMFQCVMSNHVIEHLDRPWFSVREMFRVVEVGGHVCMITPDMAYCGRRFDPTHRYEFSVDQFHEELMHHTAEGWFPPYEIVSLNTLDNSFSFEAVLKRTG